MTLFFTNLNKNLHFFPYSIVFITLLINGGYSFKLYYLNQFHQTRRRPRPVTLGN